MNNEEIYGSAADIGGAAGSGCLDWNDTLEKDEPDYILLPEGDYLFEVLDFARGRHPGSPKIPPCNRAELTLEVKTPEGTPVRVFTKIIMHKKVEWKISSFFRSIGRKQKGEHVDMDWNGVIGARGYAHIGPRTYTADGITHTVNDVKRFLDYDPEKMPPFDEADLAELDEGDQDELPF